MTMPPPRAKRSMSLNARKAEGIAYLIAYASCIPIATWMIRNLGVGCAPPGPCLIPVFPWGPGGHAMMAPSGVMMIGLALVLRDLVQRRLGRGPAVLAIVVGALLAGAFAPPALVIASVASFLISELADLAVYTPLQKRNLVLAVLASSLVGLVIDSLLFLYLAFGSLEFLEGQIVGKTWMVLLSLPFVHWIRKREGVGAVVD
jgi:uncharacterized PurR-regulated membrane protein YhhQ (DUF165 family)